MLNIIGIIPARYASSRFPAKALADIKGKSMVQRVYEQASKVSEFKNVIVATDHPLIFDHVKSFGGEVVMTKETHPSGTDRCMEVIDSLNSTIDFVVNIQGDEPFIKPEQIQLLISCLSKETQLATLAIKVKSEEELFNPNSPKVIVNNHNNAIYFSRNPIPYIRGKEKSEWHTNFNYLRHIGIYAYRSDILKSITKLKPSSLENAESLEQLRWLENGFSIKVQETTHDSFGIDTPEDLQKVLLMLN
jgi:3-deoxy-manno-octulosonate cytidylyltransferase (CMP-KDO synthetase)